MAFPHEEEKLKRDCARRLRTHLGAFLPVINVMLLSFDCVFLSPPRLKTTVRLLALAEALLSLLPLVALRVEGGPREHQKHKQETGQTVTSLEMLRIKLGQMWPEVEGLSRAGSLQLHLQSS